MSLNILILIITLYLKVMKIKIVENMKVLNNFLPSLYLKIALIRKPFYYYFKIFLIYS